MPTGYTAEIPNGMSLRTFMLRCVRAMGVCIEMRDDPMDVEPPREFVPRDSYYEKEVAAETAQIVKLRSMTEAEIEAECAKSNASRKAFWDEVTEKSRGVRAAYLSMRGKVETWIPPSPQHQNFKKFMLEQIDESVKFDCSDHEPFEPMTPQEWHKEALESAEDCLMRAKRHWAEEQKVIAEKNTWMRLFWASLPEEK